MFLGGSNASLASNHSATSLNLTSEFIQIDEQTEQKARKEKESLRFSIDQ